MHIKHVQINGALTKSSQQIIILSYLVVTSPHHYLDTSILSAKC